MARRLFWALFLACTAAASCALPAFAHTLKTDQNIGAVLHIDPNDDPVAAQPSTFFFDIKDRTSAFSLPDCQCQMSIMQGSNQLYSAGLLNAGTSGTATYTFPQTGVYQVKLYGTPVVANRFQAFSLTWDIRVEQGPGPASESNFFATHLPYFFFGSLILALGGILIWQAARRPK